MEDRISRPVDYYFGVKTSRHLNTRYRMLWMYKCNQYTTLAEKSTLDREIYRYLYTKNLYCCRRIIIVITILSKFLNILSNSSKNCKLLVSKVPMSYSRICTKMANVFGSEKDNVALIKCKKNELR